MIEIAETCASIIIITLTVLIVAWAIKQILTFLADILS
jgi:hypothetical protein